MRKYHVVIGTNNNVKLFYEKDFKMFKYQPKERLVMKNKRFEDIYIVDIRDFNRPEKPLEKFIKRNGLIAIDII